MPPAADLLRAALAAAPGPHPDADALRRYAAGTLAPAQQHRIEAHALDCERCADVLAGLAQTDAAATDRALAALRARLRARVAPAAEGRPAAGAWQWPRLAAAAAIVASVVGGGLWERQHLARRAPEVAEAPAAAPRQAAPPAAPGILAPVSSAPVAAAPPAEAQAAPAVAAASRPRPAPSVAYGVYGRNRRANAKPPRAAPPEIVGAPGDAAGGLATVSRADASVSKAKAAAPVPDSTAGAGQAPAAAKGLAGRAAGVAATLSEAAVTAPAVRKMARAQPPNSAAPSPMPAAPGLAPAPVGGLAALRETLRRQAAEFVPEAAPLAGPVRVRFVVGGDGKISGLQVLRGLRADYDAEALRLVSEGPAWVPGVAGGRRAALPVELDVVF